MNKFKWDRILQAWLAEDMPMGDVTSEAIFTAKDRAQGRFLAKEDGVLAGTTYAMRVFHLLSEDLRFEWYVRDGADVKAGTVLATVQGPVLALLKGERLALNIMQRMSGVATLSRAYARSVQDTDVRIADTRKTIPGLRELDKEAVRIGGCANHRYSLSDAAMIKDNHIAAAGGIAQAVDRVRRRVPHTTKIEVEVDSHEAFCEARDAGADIIMLDNMEPDQMARIAQENRGAALLEASGNVTLERVATIARTGVDVISVGALTHSAKALDISFKLV